MKGEYTLTLRKVQGISRRIVKLSRGDQAAAALVS
jgi:hypothetical protein